MIDPVRELKIRAELLHKGVAAGDVIATARLRALPELRRASAEALAAFTAGGSSFAARRSPSAGESGRA